jgi:hypothetical protein
MMAGAISFQVSGTMLLNHWGAYGVVPSNAFNTRDGVGCDRRIGVVDLGHREIVAEAPIREG